MSSSVIITRLQNGIQVSGPDGFEPVVFETMVNTLKEVHKRINYIETGVECVQITNIIPFPVSYKGPMP